MNNKRLINGAISYSFDVLALRGDDVKDYLQGQTTNDVSLLNLGSSQLSALLNVQGKIVSVFNLLFDHNGYKILVDQSLSSLTEDRLNQFLISEDVTIEKTSMSGLAVFGFLAAEELRQAGFSSCYVTLWGEPCYFFHDITADNKVRIDLLTENEIQWIKSSHGWIDINQFNSSKYFINETRLIDLAVSKEKGCYQGQEVVNKIRNNRGASYFPFVLNFNFDVDASYGEEFLSFDRKAGIFLGKLSSCSYFVNLFRDFRVENLKLNILFNDQTYQTVVSSYPLVGENFDSKVDDIYHAAIELFLKDIDIDLSKSLLGLVISLKKNYSDAYEMLGVIYGREGNYHQAIELMNHLLEIDPDSVLAHTNKSLFYMNLGEIEKAEEEKASATLKTFAYFGKESEEKNNRLKEQEENKAALLRRMEMFKQVLEIDSDDTLANFGLAEIFFEMNNLILSEQHLNKVLMIDERYSSAYLLLGKIYIKEEKIEQAIEIWEKGIRIAAAKGEMMVANQIQTNILQYRK